MYPTVHSFRASASESASSAYIVNIMKLTSLFIIASSFLAVSAFGVNPTSRTAIKSPYSTAFTKNAAASSPLFRDATKVRGGAVPGWAAYNEALDKKPLLTKAMTSLVGWALGDLLAQVCGGCARVSLSLETFWLQSPCCIVFFSLAR